MSVIITWYILLYICRTSCDVTIPSSTILEWSFLWPSEFCYSRCRSLYLNLSCLTCIILILIVSNCYILICFNVVTQLTLCMFWRTCEQFVLNFSNRSPYSHPEVTYYMYKYIVPQVIDQYLLATHIGYFVKIGG